jgi:hypothetical protein
MEARKFLHLKPSMCSLFPPLQLSACMSFTGDVRPNVNSIQAIAATQLLFGKLYTFLPIKSGRATKKSCSSTE